ncbi:MAG: ATP-binding cassette domain-containing protein [Thermoleophilaceae bacterium]|nr:ATP-binding cassette domain-containing protein [Thermoleophilaceae bacterium]
MDLPEPVSAAVVAPAQRPEPVSAPAQPAYAARFDAVGLTYSSRGKSTDALNGFSLDVRSGERVAVVGPSGCGKSSLLALTAALVAPTTGDVVVDEAVALMPQRDLLVPWRSALRNAALALEAQGVPKSEAARRAAPLFERFGLESFENSRTWELSGGMRQRVAFLRTVLTGRPLLALDEPFGALDSITRAQMQEWLLGALADDPRTLLLVTHDVEEALTLADRVVIVTPRPGRVAAEILVHRPRRTSRTDWVTSLEFAGLKAEALEALA